MPASRLTTQWTAGLAQGGPCETDNRTFEGSSLTYASRRAVDPARSTFSADGTMIRPFHPFTRASRRPVTPNDPALYQIEIYPTSAVFKKGERIRPTIGTANTPSTSPPVPSVVNSLGGEIRVLRGGRHYSHVLLPVAPR